MGAAMTRQSVGLCLAMYSLADWCESILWREYEAVGVWRKLSEGTGEGSGIDSSVGIGRFSEG